MANNDELANAAAQGDMHRMRELLDQGADPNGINSFDRTPIQVMKMGVPAVAQLLLERGADPNRQDSMGMALIHDVAREGFLDTLQVLVGFGHANPSLRNASNHLPVELASQSGHTDVVRYLDNLPKAE
ncbi:cyclin-dependent kinase inhibitor 2A/B (p15, inhibits CDK4) [Callorhinchus milii]|uniref:Cyclin-dependent kinase inhibitor 2A-like protein n=1 Tax=Callorhinchus milii TaxID=7868 RepID=G9J1M3_CALMI|nr:cyclin-dependent kinase inhibitor 2A/B (p15, inhibits CDK4) [Callorhinchus milii]AEW46993.1 cyclin-dependent kinase inhibitor 2A-like protein [Callorhinchus milii]|eukprot:gi/632964025/ref/XP_007898197.1/ PREDICTED: cyclin-dependent kinase inhibitor 2A, isoforms 1/2-like [Callorhinchus milii]